MAELISTARTEPAGRSVTAACSEVTPRRVLGFADLLMFYVVTGISLRWIATSACAGPSSIAVWIFA
jgi:hypothetical protein